MISCFNAKGVGDVLLVTLTNNADRDAIVTRRGQVAEIKVGAEVVGYNFFDVQALLKLTEDGQIFLNADQVAQLNQILAENNFAGELVVDDTPKIVVGEVLTCVAHPDSDHLHITETKVADDKVLQIVCGAPSVEAGQKVVAALPGAMMPDGSLIFPGNLRGVDSFGMLCSGRELHLPNASTARGILILPADAVVGSAFAVGK